MWTLKEIEYRHILHELYEHTKFTSSLLPRAVVTITIGYCLGADSSVKVVYKPISRVRGESGLINVSVNFTYTQVTEITNTRNEPTTVFFTDQIPLSRDDKLKVKRGGRERGEEERERKREDLNMEGVGIFYSSIQVTLLEPNIIKSKPGQPLPNPNLTSVNHVTWSLEFKPSETKKLIIRYSVEYPKNKQIEGL